MPAALRHALIALLSLATALAGLALVLTASPSSAATLAPHTLLVSEIAPDHVGHDHFEYVEVTNTSSGAVDLVHDVQLRYNNVLLTVDGTHPDPTDDSPVDTVLPAGGTAVLWVSYTATSTSGAVTVDSFSKTAAEFRSYWAGATGGTPGTYPLLRLTGQAGMANGGDRTLRVLEPGDATAAVVSSSHYPAGSVTTTTTAHFGVPVDGTAARHLPALTAPTPGDVAAEQLAAPTPTDPTTTPTDPTTTPTDPTTTPTDPTTMPTDPTTTPTDGTTTPTDGTTTPTEPTDPAGPGVPVQGPPPPTDPSLSAPILQVTEVAPDTANLGGADAYEFIEVYNGSDEPVGFRDFTINYLYIDASLLTTNSTLWPSVPHDPVIQPGRTLVLWIKNGGNAALTAADFNAHFGSRLTAGQDLVEITSGGMANGGLRGIQVMTNTGHDVSRAYYLNDAQTVADRPIQYRWDSGTAQTLVGTGTATPGYAAPDQVPAGLVATPDDTTAPVVRDLTGDESANIPDTTGLDLGFRATDDQVVRTVRLTVDNDVDEPATRLLQFGAPDQYLYSIPEVDLYGKRWVDYTLTASDGTHETTVGPVRVHLEEGDPQPVRLDLEEGQYVAGTTRITATSEGDPSALALTVDGSPATSTVPALEAAPYFAFEATSTDAFFRNGVKIGDDVLTVFDQGFYNRVETVTAEVPVERVVRGEPLTLGIYAGTKAWPEPSVENNDDFSAMNLRLALPDGRVLRPTSCADAGEAAGQEEAPVACPAAPDTRIGFNDASTVYYKATFEIPADAFDSIAHAWDTTAVDDGEHVVSAVAGEESVTRTVRVDNTAPTISPSGVAAGDRVRGAFTIDATATDSGAGIAPEGGLTATLDGTPITLPHETSSLELAPGDHTLALSVRDRVGNEATETVAFTTADEQPSTQLGAPEDGAVVTEGDVELSATASSPEDDLLTMRFREGYTFVPTDAEVSAYAGTTGVARGADRSGKVVLTADQLEQLGSTDGLTHEVTSATQFPYQLFTVAVPADAGDDATARLSWTGSANAGSKVLMYVRDATTGAWEEVARHLPADTSTFELEALVPTAGHVEGGQVTVLIQHSEGFAGPQHSTRDSAPAPYHPGATPRSAYDFTIGWESDTQYYNETPDFYEHQLAINQFFLDQREELNLQYVIHTGDIVNVAEDEQQWLNADPAYRKFDEAGLPYGVLAGNHDVGHHSTDYSHFSRWFGEHRFAGNPWYGGSHQDNRGHYDLISANGVDFLMLSMGWGPGDEQIAWMNRVIRKYPERKVWISLHEFMLTTGGLGPIPQRIMDEVVATNPNVFAVSSGHYHDAYTRTDEFDDDGDGTADRTVHSMLFDYQGLPQGGLGYLRLLHFDNEGGRILVRTYSPSLHDHDADDPSLEQVHQEFQIPYAAAGIEPATKTLATDSFRADILTTRLIAMRSEVPSGSTQTVPWAVGPGEHGWYVEVVGPHGAVDRSEVRTVVVEAAGAVPAGSAGIRGPVRVGQTVTAAPSGWPSGTTFGYQWRVDGRAVPGATGRAFRIGPSLRGHKLSVAVTGSLGAKAPTTVVSPATVVAAGRLVPGRPWLTGTPQVGRRLTVRPGSWAPSPVRLHYAWFANGRRVAGAAGPSLVLGRAQAGKRITARVIGSRAGYLKVVRHSPASGVVRRR